MKKLLLLIPLFLFVGCANAQERSIFYRQEAEECFDDGGYPVFIYTEGSYTSVSTLECMYRQ